MLTQLLLPQTEPASLFLCLISFRLGPGAPVSTRHTKQRRQCQYRADTFQRVSLEEKLENSPDSRCILALKPGPHAWQVEYLLETCPDVCDVCPKTLVCKPVCARQPHPLEE